MAANVEGKKMKPEEIKRLVAKSENAAVEFKRARSGMFCGRISCGGAV